jgi:hypothetical protein
MLRSHWAAAVIWIHDKCLRTATYLIAIVELISSAFRCASSSVIASPHATAALGLGRLPALFGTA